MRKPNNLAIIESRDRLAPWLERIQGDTRLAVDTETTGGINGTRWFYDRVGALCLATRDTAIYVCKDALGPAAHWLGDQVKAKRSLVMHHAKYDMHMMRGTFGLHIDYPVDDTKVMSFLLDNRGCAPIIGGYPNHHLKDLAGAFVDPDAKAPQTALLQAIREAGGKDMADVLLAPTNISGVYGAMDAWYTLQLGDIFEERLDHWYQPEGYPTLRSLYETERWLILALRDMEERGVLVNQDFFEQWNAKLEKKLKKTYQRLEKIARREINWNSAPQLRKLLYEDLDLPVTRWTKGGKKSPPQPSTDEVSLLELNHPIGAELLRLRDLTKQKGTYAEGLLRAIWPDGRIHTNFKQDGADTGRLSAEDPNLQQVPRESGARRGFIPDPGLEFRFGDYSQVEMRYAAHLSNDPTMVHGFNTDPDFDTHAATAQKMWGLPGAPTSQQRKFAKIMNFAMLYGAGETKITSQLIALLSVKEAKHAVASLGHKLSAGEAPHRTLAQLLRARYHKEFSSVKGASYRARDQAERMGYAMNVFGRHRFLEEGKSYTAFNTEIQGSAADQAKKGLVNLYRELQVKDGSIALLLQIHDEAFYLSDGDPKVDRRVLELLNDQTTFRVPIVADMKGSKTSWQDKVTINLEKAA